MITSFGATMEDSAATMADNVAHAIAAALDWSSPPDARKAAFSFSESVKAGDVRALASACFLLVKKNWPSEIRLHAFKMLQEVEKSLYGQVVFSQLGLSGTNEERANELLLRKKEDS